MKKILINTTLVILILGIFAYILVPNSESKPIVVTSTTVPVVDPPCNILFNSNEDTFLVENNQCIATYIGQYSNSIYSSLLIECRASADGDSKERQQLSDDRAKQLKYILMDRGVDSLDITISSYGDTFPLPGVDQSAPEGKMLNRSCQLTGVIKASLSTETTLES
jgi:outer membrane protein OmpA-like peptidoglycan-associated protein